MARNARIYSNDAPPVVSPTAAGDEWHVTTTGAVFKAIVSADGETLYWRMLSGPSLDKVRGVIRTNLAAGLTLSTDGMTATRSSNESMNTPGYGGLTTWALGDRVALADQNGEGVAHALNGLWEVYSLGSGSAPWVLIRALDARDTESFPVGRQVFVQDGHAAGQVFEHATTGTASITIGTTGLVMRQLGAVPYTASGVTIAATRVIEVDVAAGSGGGRDVTVYNANAPFGFEVLEMWGNITTAVTSSTVQARTASGGGGSALSGTVSSAAVGRQRDAAGGSLVSNPVVAVGGSLYLRMSDGDAAGRFYLHIRPLG